MYRGPVTGYDYLDLEEGDMVMLKQEHGGNMNWGVIVKVDRYSTIQPNVFCYKILWPQHGDGSWIAPYEIEKVIRVNR